MIKSELNQAVLELMQNLSAINLGQLAMLQGELIKISSEEEVKRFLELLQSFLPGRPAMLLARIDAVVDSRDAVIPINLDWSPEWIELYWERKFYRVDPVLNGNRDKVFYWSRDIHGLVRPSAPLRYFQSACRQYGMLHGVTYVSEVAGGHRVMISLRGREVEESLHVRALLEHILPAMAEAAAKVLNQASWMAKLTVREREMFQLVIENGLTYKEAAVELGVSYGTIKTYMQNMVKRNGYRNLVHMAWGWRG